MALTFRYLITQRLLCLAYPIFQNTLHASEIYHSIKNVYVCGGSVALEFVFCA
jgi:hypothetical protein